jgi:GDP-D-mannose dehydratase
MDRINELLRNPEKYEFSPQEIDGLRELKRIFDGNPFFPMEPYVYAKNYLYGMYARGAISGDLMQSILSDF